MIQQADGGMVLTLLGVFSMALMSEEEAILAEAVSGISRVAEAIGSLSARDCLRAFEAAERSYRKTAQDLGYTEEQASGWAASLTVMLRSEVAALVEARLTELDNVA